MQIGLVIQMNDCSAVMDDILIKNVSLFSVFLLAFIPFILEQFAST